MHTQTVSVLGCSVGAWQGRAVAESWARAEQPSETALYALSTGEQEPGHSLSPAYLLSYNWGKEPPTSVLKGL